MFKLEVKTTYKGSHSLPSNSKLFGYSESAWMMKEGHENIKDKNLFYCFVNIHKDTNLFSFYIVPSKVVAKYVKDEHTLWIKTDSESKRKDGSMRMFRFGKKGEKYRIKTPLPEDYKNNWNFKV